ncbi:MAG: hypothetical protein OEY88_01025 [Candidatus Bathyarchaeota archaeon]|nr:hypothetical protein [Candidatus Bathyarchaeota archaeon]
MKDFLSDYRNAPKKLHNSSYHQWTGLTQWAMVGILGGVLALSALIIVIFGVIGKS